MEYLQWQIDGEFICNIARTWFWDENRPYEKSEELLLSALGTDEITLDEKRRIAQDIIEGRKKLVGINTCTLEDDNERIRPISNKIAQLNRKLLIKEIEEHMELYAIRYVDSYSTVKSIQSAIEIKNVSTYEEAYDYFCFGEYDFKKNNDLTMFHPETKCGLWLLDYPELVADYYGKPAPKEDTYEAEKFWESIYEAVKDKTNKEFKERNKKYLTVLKIKKEDKMKREKYYEEQYEKIMSENQLDISFEKSMDLPEEGYAAYLMNQEPGNIDYNVLPDDYNKFEGLISPDGKFYSCTFGGHNLKAYHIMMTYYKEFGYQTREEAYTALFHIDKALDKLIDCDWMATRYRPAIGSYLTYKDDIYFRPTKEQKDAIWEAIVKHDVRVNNVDIIL